MVRAYSKYQKKLIDITRVKVSVPNEDLPGKPMQIIACASCCEQIFDHGDHERDHTLCRSCANGPYYEKQAHPKISRTSNLLRTTLREETETPVSAQIQS